MLFNTESKLENPPKQKVEIITQMTPSPDDKEPLRFYQEMWFCQKMELQNLKLPDSE